jgi:histone acetyltransferase (RNA polymerase elongator complex component)
MSVAKRQILPFFIPHLGCPNRCIFCDQHKIAGKADPPTQEELWAALQKLPENSESNPQEIELAFYGGSFTALPESEQEYYLQPAYRAMQEGRIAGIRLSTRPDAIDERRIALLKKYGVGTVELGVQSMNNEVLRLAKRGHTVEDSERALALLQNAGFKTSVQLMPGLPGETADSAFTGAVRILKQKPDMLRIYPLVVLAETECAELYQSGQYQPLTLDEAVEITLDITLFAEEYGVAVIRMGLQPSDELAADVVAGPYHPAFGSLVRGLWWRKKILYVLERYPDAQIFVNKRDLSAVIGQNRQNMAFYEEIQPKIRFKTAGLPPNDLLAREQNGHKNLFTNGYFHVLWRQSQKSLWLPF